jgi:antitoxin CcdA
MLPTRESAKRAVNLSLTASVLETARSMGLNISQTVDQLLAAEVERLYWKRWNEDNKAAIDHYNARIAKEGLPLAKYRTFLKGR